MNKNPNLSYKNKYSLMKPFSLITAVVVLFSLLSCETPQKTASEQSLDPEDIQVIRSIFDEALVNGKSYDWLRELCIEVGPRLSGSEGANKAVIWGKSLMESLNFDKVFLQDVMVPHWERGPKESARILDGAKLNMLAIGGSVATPKGGIKATVVEVQSLEEVEELGEAGVKDKIIFYNRAFDQRNIQTGAGYGGVVDQRSQGASQGAKYGALAIVMRSASSSFDDAPHTGALNYAEDIPRIPAGALGVQSAILLSQELKKQPNLELQLVINSIWHEDAPSHNVVGELLGSESEKIITVGGHLDSWDVGQGAHDDAAGCVHSIEALNLLKTLGIKPKHTLRAVLFMNEENGTRGGQKYAEIAKEADEKHLIAIESDAGGFSPRGFGLSGPDEMLARMRSWLPLFPQNTISYINKGGGGVDVGPIHREIGVPMMGLSVDPQRTFDYHHSPNDVFEMVNRRELLLGSASLAAMIYLIDKYEQ